MRRGLLLLLCVVLAPTASASEPISEGLREQVRIYQAMVQRDVQELEEQRARLQEAWVRVERGAADLVAAQDQGESLDSLSLRDEDLRKAESELMMELFAGQRLRRSLLQSQAMIETTEIEVQRLEGEVGPSEDPITGTWRLVLEPGGQEGVMSLRLDGTLVQGTYRLSGDWSGSLRGTFVAGKVRLERVDAQLGFAAIMYGRLSERGPVPRMEGSWEATQLASGLPSGGNWVAEREDESSE
jgi:hypothetical protein